MSQPKERVKGITKRETEKDLANVKNAREILTRMACADYYWDGYAQEYLGMLENEIQENLAKFTTRPLGRRKSA